MAEETEGGQPPYEYKAWPAWRTGPNGEREIFQRPEDVPPEWTDEIPNTEPAPVAVEQPAPVGVEEPADKGGDVTVKESDEDAVANLVDNYTADNLVGMLEAMQALDDKIEFLKTWPKLKLATVIVENGGPLPKEG